LRSARDGRAFGLLRCCGMRGPAFLVLVAVSFSVLVSDGCARRHYRVIVTETLPSAAHRRGPVKSATADARTRKPTAGPSNSLQPSAVPSSGAVGTSGDVWPHPQGMQGSDGLGAQPPASIAGGDRPSRSGSSTAVAEPSRSPYDGSPASETQSPSPVLAMGIAAAILVAIFTLRRIRRDGTLLGH